MKDIGRNRSVEWTHCRLGYCRVSTALGALLNLVHQHWMPPATRGNPVLQSYRCNHTKVDEPLGVAPEEESCSSGCADVSSFLEQAFHHVYILIHCCNVKSRLSCNSHLKTNKQTKH